MAVKITPTFRVSYPSVFEKRLNKLSGKQEYSVMAIFPKGTDLTELKAAANAAIVEKWGADKAKWPKDPATGAIKIRNPFRPHEDRKDKETGALPEGMEAGGLYLTLRAEKNRPQVVDQKKNEILDPSDFYAGCWARASVTVYAYQHASGNCGVNFGLNNLQKVKEGDPLGSRTRAQDDFQPVELPPGADNGGNGATSADGLFS